MIDSTKSIDDATPLNDTSGFAPADLFGQAAGVIRTVLK